MQSRDRRPEIMDQPGLERSLHEHALRGLGRINLFSRSTPQLWSRIAKFQARSGRKIRILDLACGGGDVIRGIARMAKAEGVPIEAHGADLSNQAINFASSKSREQGLDLDFFRLDALADPLPTDYDILTCSLFFHHLSDEDAGRLLGRMADATRGMVLVDDLLRTRTGYALAYAGCRLLSRSKVVHHDGPASVSAAFRIEEIRAMVKALNLPGVTITKHWPERFLLSWSRP